MRDFNAATYGDRVASVYDDWFSRVDPTSAVNFLGGLADKRPVLELGIGTGRIALPLASRGLSVTGIEVSTAMVEGLRRKPGAEAIRVIVADFCEVPVSGEFGLIYAAFNSFFALRSQEEQIKCLRAVSSHLMPGGLFVLDAFVPDPTRYRNYQSVIAEDVGVSHVMLEVTRHDPVTQVLESSHVVVAEEGIRAFPVVLRYAWPAELDAMAIAASLTAVERYNDYDRRPFGRASTHHVSIYRRGVDEGRS